MHAGQNSVIKVRVIINFELSLQYMFICELWSAHAVLYRVYSVKMTSSDVSDAYNIIHSYLFCLS